MRQLFVSLVVVIQLSAGFAQNLILNPSFDAPPGLDGTGGNSYNGMVETWDQMPYWEPPKKTYQALGNIGTSDFYSSHFRSFPYCAHTGTNEYIVGEVPSGLIPGHLYYFTAYSNSVNIEEKRLDVYFSQNRARQRNSFNPVHFKPSDNPKHIIADVSHVNNGEEWRRMNKVFTLGEENCDRITIGVWAPQGGGGESAVLGGSVRFDDLELIHLGPGGTCPNIRLIQNIVYDDEVILYKASEKIIAGYDVGATYISTGPVMVSGNSDITYRAGEEVVLQDGFSVVEGGTFHAFIEPCDCETPVPIAGSDEVICDGVPIQLGAEGLTYLDYQWSSSPANGINYLSNPNSPNPTYNPPSNTFAYFNYTLTATNSCGESVSDDVFVVSTGNPVPDPELISVGISSPIDTYQQGLLFLTGQYAEQFLVQVFVDGAVTPAWSESYYAFTDFEPGGIFDHEIPYPFNSCHDYEIVVSYKNFCNPNWWDTPAVFTIDGHEGSPVVEDLSHTLWTESVPPNNAIWLQQSGFTHYSLAVESSSGNEECFEVNNVEITGNLIQIFDGNANQSVCSFNHGTHYYELQLVGCNGEVVNMAGVFTILGGTGPSSGKKEEDANDPGEHPSDEDMSVNPSSYRFLVYPNPNSGSFTVTGSSLEEIVILDVTGKLVKQLNGDTRTNLQIDGLGAGLYIIQAQMTDGSIENSRVVVQ